MAELDDTRLGTEPGPRRPGWRRTIHEIIFEADTPTGKVFDVLLLVAIIASVVFVMLESVKSIKAEWGAWLVAAEWTLTALFTLEYVLRLVSVARPWSYATSFFGIVDFIAIAPTYLSLFIPGAHSLVVVRTLRVVRIFRIFKMARYLRESRTLLLAWRETREKIVVFLVFVCTAMLIVGALLWVIEGEINEGFDSIPRGVYWAIVTITTVGYGDITPITPAGQVLAACAMILGYSVIIVPTGVFSAEVLKQHKVITTQACQVCSREGHDFDAAYCKYCGSKLEMPGR